MSGITIVDDSATDTCITEEEFPQTPHNIPDALIDGLVLMRMTGPNKKSSATFKINPQTFELSWGPNADSRCSIASIEEIREGDDAAYYREAYGVHSSLSSRWASIFFVSSKEGRHNASQLHVYASTIEHFRLFLNTLRPLVVFSSVLSAMPGLSQQKLQEEWNRRAAIMPGIEEKCVSFPTLKRLLEAFFVYYPEKSLLQKYTQVVGSTSRYMSYEQFKQLVQLLRTRDDIAKVFDKHADLINLTPTKMSFPAFRNFCVSVQNMTSEIDIKEMFDTYATDDNLSLAQFSHILMEDRCMPIITPTMNRLDEPITNYFISSSHNTYLMGRQIVGEASCEPYMHALLKGCRCVEIDVWDDDDVPVVTHGKTFSSQVSFQSVIETINEHAFVASEMPVILSFEIHCNMMNQKRMVEMMKRIFGDKLATEKLMTNAVRLPWLEDLKNKILVKVKPGQNRFGSSGVAVPGLVLKRQMTENMLSSDESSDSNDSSDDALEDGRRTSEVELHRARVKCTITNELGDLGVYLQGIKFKDFRSPACKIVNHCFSLKESVIDKMAGEEQELQLIKHNQGYFMRVYPHGGRVYSSNYEPVRFWQKGCQMVALNWQTYGK